MSHDIATIDGKDAMFVVGKREDAWHMLGQRCENAPTWEEAIKLAGLDWKVLKQKNFARRPDGTVKEVNSCTIFRDIDNAELGTVGPDFAIKQNADCFKFVDTLLEANGGSHYDSAGALGNGSKIWCAVRVPKADIEVTTGDKHESYLVFATAHDGSMAHTVKLTSVRVVCQNTLNMALQDGGGMFRVKHTKSADARLDRAKGLMQGVTMDAAKLSEKLKALAARRMTRDSMKTIFDRLFPAPKEENANTTRRENVLAEVLALYEQNDNNAFPQIKGTAYNLLNAVTEYTDHFRTARITDNRAGYSLGQARAENAVVGTGDVLKSNALEIIMQSTGENPVHSTIYSKPASGSLLDDVLSNHS